LIQIKGDAVTPRRPARACAAPRRRHRSRQTIASPATATANHRGTRQAIKRFGP
jgi:hypothetical protein